MLPKVSWLVRNPARGHRGPHVGIPTFESEIVAVTTSSLSFDDDARNSGWTNPLVVYPANRRFADSTTPTYSNIIGASETTLARCVAADQPLDWAVSV